MHKKGGVKKDNNITFYRTCNWGAACRFFCSRVFVAQHFMEQKIQKSDKITLNALINSWCIWKKSTSPATPNQSKYIIRQNIRNKQRNSYFGKHLLLQLLLKVFHNITFHVINLPIFFLRKKSNNLNITFKFYI